MKQPQDKKNFRHIHEAYRSFRKKNYTNAIIILDQLKSHGIEDKYALFLQAVSLLYSNNFSAANSFMEKIQRIDPLYEPFIQLKSFLALKSAINREAAIAAYISSIEINPVDKLLRKGLRLVESAKDFYKYQKESKIADLVYIPSPGKGETVLRPLRAPDTIRRMKWGGFSFKINPIIVFVIAAVVVIFVSGTIYFINHSASNNQGEGAVSLDYKSLSKIDMVDLSGSGYGIINRVNRERTPEFYASGDELVKDFNEAKQLIKRGYMNRAVKMLNRITNSNASFPVKEKSDFLVRFIMESDERAYEDLDLKQINEKPYIFRGTAVKLTGRVANIKEMKDGKAFSLMVDYDGKNFKCICEVYDKGENPIANGDIVEVRGLFVLNIGKAGVPYISSEKLKIISKNSIK